MCGGVSVCISVTDSESNCGCREKGWSGGCSTSCPDQAPELPITPLPPSPAAVGLVMLSG